MWAMPAVSSQATSFQYRPATGGTMGERALAPSISPRSQRTPTLPYTMATTATDRTGPGTATSAASASASAATLSASAASSKALRSTAVGATASTSLGRGAGTTACGTT